MQITGHKDYYGLGGSVVDNTRLKTGDVVVHFKRELLSEEEKRSLKYVYIIEGICLNTDTLDNMVVYRPLYSLDDHCKFDCFARPYDDFMGEVDKKRYKNIKQKYKFEKFDSENNTGQE